MRSATQRLEPKMLGRRSKNIYAEKRPYFYKIMFPGLSDQHLRIPPEFVKHIPKEASKSAILEDSSGSHWCVKLSKTTHGIYLQDGWQEFVRDHCLWDNEFLLFRYDGNMQFSVRIFDKSGCEIEDVFTTETHQESAYTNGRKKWNKRLRDTVGSAHPSQSKICKLDPGQCIPSLTSDKFKRIEREQVNLNIHEKESKIILSSSRRRPATQEEKIEVWKAAESFKSMFPYFTVCLKASNVYKAFVLHIPRGFAYLLPRCKTKITLLNPKGQSWTVNSLYIGKRTALCGGWPAFVHANKLEEGDICIFELVGKIELQVHIFRVVKEVKFMTEEKI